MRRSLEPFGEAWYSPAEEEVVRQLLASDSPTRHREVAFLHELKATFDAALVDPETPTREVEGMRAKTTRKAA